MIELSMNFHSNILRTGVAVRVLVPETSPEPASQSLPVLYLLHDLSGDENSFLRYTSLERHLEKEHLVAVMPRVARSFGVDLPAGPAYGRFLSEELPALVEQLFPVSRSASHRFVAGVDAGGYAAFRLALTFPDRYAAAVALSAPLVLDTLFTLPDEEITQELESVFGPRQSLLMNGHLLDALLSDCAASGAPTPRLFHLCGAEDFFVSDNRRFAALAGRLNAGAKYRETAGEHDWNAWDAMLPQVLSFIRDI